ncbi:hypothetical protein E2C01_049683 [Portunus trituberculatus]|uniref:Uncharacterized protein n=1 Tax=Portunus trituberculatus TaxID=210409 RepID=A0A5B7GDS0_PORTR|nr:hypothetical protein [Portunus trituberculatus]
MQYSSSDKKKDRDATHFQRSALRSLVVPAPQRPTHPPASACMGGVALLCMLMASPRPTWLLVPGGARGPTLSQLSNRLPVYDISTQL